MGIVVTGPSRLTVGDWSAMPRLPKELQSDGRVGENPINQDRPTIVIHCNSLSPQRYAQGQGAKQTPRRCLSARGSRRRHRARPGYQTSNQCNSSGFQGHRGTPVSLSRCVLPGVASCVAVYPDCSCCYIKTPVFSPRDGRSCVVPLEPCHHQSLCVLPFLVLLGYIQSFYLHLSLLKSISLSLSLAFTSSSPAPTLFRQRRQPNAHSATLL
jgi:hypothetical protein